MFQFPSSIRYCNWIQVYNNNHVGGSADNRVETMVSSYCANHWDIWRAMPKFCWTNQWKKLRDFYILMNNTTINLCNEWEHIRRSATLHIFGFPKRWMVVGEKRSDSCKIWHLFYVWGCRLALYVAIWYSNFELEGRLYCYWRECSPSIGSVDHIIVVYGPPPSYIH